MKIPFSFISSVAVILAVAIVSSLGRATSSFAHFDEDCDQNSLEDLSLYVETGHAHCDSPDRTLAYVAGGLTLAGLVVYSMRKNKNEEDGEGENSLGFTMHYELVPSGFAFSMEKALTENKTLQLRMAPTPAQSRFGFGGRDKGGEVEARLGVLFSFQ
ncbi:MAG: hypothetical protein MPJ79_05240 [Alphaproteobacteria bacterium]|nr:hypothetical protein [Alphaproteobacteria bacterium]MDA7989359.1 hypothetical protein [Alphaproteobacteria bacterium]MDA8009378.1 hypothetical protein [Alphaproteobacteria bacterium]MDA8032297.1 hypothetical protein [Alphaproteobacteria bacterium]